jgi:hypothetical protein
VTSATVQYQSLGRIERRKRNRSIRVGLPLVFSPRHAALHLPTAARSWRLRCVSRAPCSGRESDSGKSRFGGRLPPSTRVLGFYNFAHCGAEMARDVWTEVMRRTLGGSTAEERERVETILASWDYQYHRRFTSTIRCEARCRDGHACRAPSMRNGRCKLHGGKSTGPKTAAGLARIRAAQRRRWKRWRAARVAQSGKGLR